MIPLSVKVAALGHSNTMWRMMSKAMGMKKDESKRLRLRCTKIALQLSYLPVPQSETMAGAAAHPVLRSLRWRMNVSATKIQLHQKQKQTDQIRAESTAVELNSGYGVYEADLVTCSVTDETAVPSDGPIMICAERSVCS